MSEPNPALSLPWGTSESISVESAPSPQEEAVDQLLAQAAELAASSGIDADDFVHASWQAFLDARPGLREQIEEKELRAQLKKLRKRGLVGSA